MTSEFISEPFITSPTTKKVFSLFDSLREKKSRFDVASCGLITGESGSGKSQLAKRYFQKNQPLEEENRRRIPVFHYELKEASTIKNVLRGALRNLIIAGGNEDSHELYERLVNSRSTEDEILWSFTQLLKSTGVELIILDEIQVILQRRNLKVVSGLADTFKDLIKDTQIPIVFMGMPWSRYLVESNAQLNGRIDYRIEIEPFRVSKKLYRNEYRMLLRTLASRYKFPESVQLHKFDFLLKIFSHTEGNLRETAGLVRDVYLDALMCQTKIDYKSFPQLLSQRGVKDDQNPFLKELKNIDLREMIEHTDYRLGQTGNKKSIVDAKYATYCVDKNNEIRLVA